MPPRVLVLGATGMLGHRMVSVLSRDLSVHAAARDLEFAAQCAPGAELHRLDATQPEGISAALAEAQPDAVVNCIGIVKQLREASDPVASISVNSLFPHLVAAACAERSIRFLQVSTDCVFSGRLPAPALYTEEHPADPEDLYGRSKLLGETSGPGALTLRTSIIGWEPRRASGLLEWLASQAGRPVGGFVNALFSGLTTSALSEVVHRILVEFPDLDGLFHVASEPISKFDLLIQLNDALDLGCSIEPKEEPRVNRALDSSRLFHQTGVEVPGWDDMIAGLVQEKR
jgi:dTDP-4-dehydrorhamnose reductase